MRMVTTDELLCVIVFVFVCVCVCNVVRSHDTM